MMSPFSMWSRRGWSFAAHSSNMMPHWQSWRAGLEVRSEQSWTVPPNLKGIARFASAKPTLLYRFRASTHTASNVSKELASLLRRRAKANFKSSAKVLMGLARPYLLYTNSKPIFRRPSSKPCSSHHSKSTSNVAPRLFAVALRQTVGTSIVVL